MDSDSRSKSVRSAANDSVATAWRLWGTWSTVPQNDLEKNRVKACNTPLGVIPRSIFTLRRLRPGLRVTRRLRRRMHARIGIPLLPLPPSPHSERRRIDLPWAEYRYRQDFDTFSRQTWVLLPLVRITNYRIRMRDQRFEVISSGIAPRQPCSWIEWTEADHFLPTTKVLISSATRRAYGITSSLGCSPPADDQLF
jgi:hypothetical protein